MKLRQLNDFILELDKPNPYKIDTIGFILFESLRSLVVLGDIDTIQEFIDVNVDSMWRVAAKPYLTATQTPYE